MSSDPRRRQLWKKAWADWRFLGGSAKFIFGTHHDRQTGALRAHRYRKEVGFHQPPPKDNALCDTKGSDGETRRSTWTPDHGKGIRLLTPLAQRISIGAYKPEPLKLARWPKPNGRGTRVVAVPTVYDRLAHSVLLELMEPIIDPILSPWQHGYRAKEIAGREIIVPGFNGIARGSTEIVARRMLRAVRAGYVHLAELDIVDAFPSVDRAILKAKLIDDGCPKRFARQIIRALGDEAIDPDRGGKVVEVTGIPLGSPIGPLLFGFYVRGVHDDRAGMVSTMNEVIGTSYADNFFLASKSAEQMDEAIEELGVRLEALGLTAGVVQRTDLRTRQGAEGTQPPVGEQILKILKEWEIRIEGNQGVVLVHREEDTETLVYGQGQPHGGVRAGRVGSSVSLGVVEDHVGLPLGADALRSSSFYQGPSSPGFTGIRMETAKGGHHPEGIRYDHALKPGCEQDLAVGHLAAVPLDGVLGKSALGPEPIDG